MEQDGECRFRQAHRRGSIRLVELGKVAKGQCPLIAGVEGVECCSEPVGVALGVEAIDVVDRHSVMKPVDGSLAAVATPAGTSAIVIGELVRGDPEEPRGDTAPSPREAVDAGKRLLERDGGEILGEFAGTTPSMDECEDPIDVEAIEVCERIGIVARLLGELPLSGGVRG